MKDDLKIFSAGSNDPLAEEICGYLDIPLSNLEISRFSNDNLSIQICENVRERDVFVVQPFSQPVSDNIQDFMLPLDCTLDQDQWLELEDLSVPVVYVWFDYYI